MSMERLDPISVRIIVKLSEQPNTSYMRHRIFKVHDSLRSENKQAYEPKILSIGPYHYTNRKLKQMETHKLGYVQQLLSREGKYVYEYISVIRKLEDKARRFYAEEINLSEDEFVEMLFVDGCFIIEFLSNWHSRQPWNQNTPIMDMDRLQHNIARDLILFENQVPFFVLIELCKITGQDLLALARNLCHVMPDWKPTSDNTRILADEVIHLLDFVHKVLCSSFVTKSPDSERDSERDLKRDPVRDPRPTASHTGTFANKVIHLLDFVHKVVWCSSFVAKPPDSERDCSKSFIKSASDLQYSGITFEKDTRQNQSWLDITFENGELKIPLLTVTNNTESIFRNLIAYEQYETNPQYRRCISDYVKFLDRLIDSPRDVTKLRYCGIIRNWLGDDAAVSTIFNKLGNGIIIHGPEFIYKNVFEQVNNYSCQRWNIRWKKWKTQLKKNYFKTPWSIISFLAALVLLTLTFMQTIFSFLQYVKQ